MMNEDEKKVFKTIHKEFINNFNEKKNIINDVFEVLCNQKADIVKINNIIKYLEKLKINDNTLEPSSKEDEFFNQLRCDESLSSTSSEQHTRERMTPLTYIEMAQEEWFKNANESSHTSAHNHDTVSNNTRVIIKFNNTIIEIKGEFLSFNLKIVFKFFYLD